MAEISILDGRHAMRPQRIGRVFGWFFVATFLTSIPAYFIGYRPMLDNPASSPGPAPIPPRTWRPALRWRFSSSSPTSPPPWWRTGPQARERDGSCRLRRSPSRGGHVIAIGIVGALAFLLVRQEATAVSNPALGHAFVGLLPGVSPRARLFAGLANGVILGYPMYRSGSVPRGMAMAGLIGGPLVMATGIAVMFDAIPRGGAVQTIATIPEFFWELSLSIYCIIKGFRLSSPSSGR